ncbi:MAG: AraC family transcriptional regulator, partial [Salegentibacter mishustinae]|nr:AraC family transcriptional regulator [Salegentibacter mishustinae]
METYHLELNDVEDFIPELAKSFETHYFDDLGEYSLKIPEDKGTGNIQGINFPNGVGLYNYSCSFYEDLKLKISHPIINPIRFIYCIQGRIDTYFDNNKDAKTIEDHQFLIAAPMEAETQNFVFKKNTFINICYLEIDRLKFQQYFSFNLNDLEPIFYKIFSDIKAKNRICDTGSFSPKTADIIREINNCELQGFPRVNFMGAKALEILSFMLSRFKKEEENLYQKHLSEKDLKALEKVVNHINSNLAKAGTVESLAKVAGMNSNKLQEIFQIVYGKTVNAYVRDIRLTKALQMLSSGNKNV